MRRLTVLSACLAALTVAACGEREKAPASSRTLTIKTDDTPRPPPASKGKLEVLPPGTEAVQAQPATEPEPLPDAGPAGVEPPEGGEQVAPADGGDEPRDEHWAEGPPVYDPRGQRWARAERPPTARDCRRAARAGAPLAGSPFCRDVLSAEAEEALADDCIAADRAGDDFAFSPQCRRVLGH